MTGYLDDVVIIGAGLGGCALALALSAKNIPVTIYESRPEVSGVVPSGVILTPNGLRILDRLGVYSRIKDRCYISTHRYFLNDDDEITKQVPLGGPSVNGYWNHRIWRGLLLDEMRLMLHERNISIHYKSKFTGITSNTDSHVTFTINNSTHRTSLLIASDGINSTLRPYLSPTTTPTYTGLLGILAHIPWTSVPWPSHPHPYPRNATIQSRTATPIFYIAEDPSPTPTIMTGLQIPHPLPATASALAALQADKPALLHFYQRDAAHHGATAQNIIAAIAQHPHTLYLWPFMRMPALETWYSRATGRVVLVGDAAHALPPSSGQGVNQAVEDAYSLVAILDAVLGSQKKEGLGEEEEGGRAKEQVLHALAFWQGIRQERIDGIAAWTERTSNVSRLPEKERMRELQRQRQEEEAAAGEGEETKAQSGQSGDDMSWLFQYDYDAVIARWLESREEERGTT